MFAAAARLLPLWPSPLITLAHTSLSTPTPPPVPPIDSSTFSFSSSFSSSSLRFLMSSSFDSWRPTWRRVSLKFSPRLWKTEFLIYLFFWPADLVALPLSNANKFLVFFKLQVSWWRHVKIAAFISSAHLKCAQQTLYQVQFRFAWIFSSSKSSRCSFSGSNNSRKVVIGLVVLV